MLTSKHFLSVLLFAVLGCVLTFSVQAANTADIVLDAKALASTDLSTLRSHFSRGNWGVDRAENGDLLLYPGAGIQMAKAEKPVEMVPKKPILQGFNPAHIARLKSWLEPHGWRVKAGSKGDVLLFPQVQQAQAAPASTDYQGINVLAMAQQQDTRRWHFKADGNGGMLMFPPQVRPAVVDFAALSVKSVRHVPTYGFGSREVSRLKDWLEPHGWRVKRDGMGGVLLFPRAG